MEHFLFDYQLLLREQQPKWVSYAVPSMVSMVCFFTLYLVADDHLNRSLELLATRCRMSPSMAGLTLLAFGNGASDFFAAVIGASESPTMILGGSLGAGLFITALVLGCTLIFARSHPVAMKDHEGQLAMAKSSRTVCVDKGAFLRSAGLYLMCTVAVMYFGYTQVIHLWQTVGLLLIFCLYIGAAIIVHIRGGHGKIVPEEADVRDGKQNINYTIALESILDEWEAESWFIRFLVVAKRCASIKFSSAKRAVASLIRFPVDALLFFTVAPLPAEEATFEEEAVYRYFRFIRNHNYPSGFSLLLLFVLYHNDVRNGYFYAAVLILSLIWGIVNRRLSPKWRQDCPPNLQSILCAFCASLLWIYVATKELLAALTFLGAISGIDQAILGMTILAWGNSCGDLVSNVALAMNGHAETAIIAAFSGPIQNVLLTLGVSFAMACYKDSRGMVKFDVPDVAFYLTGGTLVGVLLVLLVTVPFVFHYTIPKGVGFVLAAGYAVFVAANLLRIVLSKK